MGGVTGMSTLWLQSYVGIRYAKKFCHMLTSLFYEGSLLSNKPLQRCNL